MGAQSCRNCAHYGGSGRVTKNDVYPCLAPVPDVVPMLPLSVSCAYGFDWPPAKSYMGPNDGAGCPTWTTRA